MSHKVYDTAAAALKDVPFDGMTVMSGGFGLCGIAENLIAALRDSGAKDLTVISNNAGVDGFGLGQLLETRQIKKMLSSYVGENKEFERHLNLTPKAHWPSVSALGGRGFPAFIRKPAWGLWWQRARNIKTLAVKLTSWKRG